MKYVFLITVFILSMTASNAQIGLGMVSGLDLYQYYRIPDYGQVKGHSTGSAIANFIFGPKIWLGGEVFSVSVEGAVSFAPFAFNLGDYKGLGAVSFPMSVDLNFMGLSGFSREAKGGFSIGAGMSFNRTELYFVKDDFSESRTSGFYRVYYGQVAYGYGSGGTNVSLYVRYGQGEKSSMFITSGIKISVNYLMNKKEPIGK